MCISFGCAASWLHSGPLRSPVPSRHRPWLPHRHRLIPSAGRPSPWLFCDGQSVLLLPSPLLPALHPLFSPATISVCVECSCDHRDRVHLFVTVVITKYYRLMSSKPMCIFAQLGDWASGSEVWTSRCLLRPLCPPRVSTLSVLRKHLCSDFLFLWRCRCLG